MNMAKKDVSNRLIIFGSDRKNNRIPPFCGKKSCLFTPAYQKSCWYDLQFLRKRALQTEIGNYRSSFGLFPQKKKKKKKKIKILKKKKRKKFRKYHHFTHVYQKSQSYDIRFLRYRVRQTEFFVILDHFLPFYSTNNPQNENFEKMKKNNWGFYWFTLNHHKWQSYHVWFLKHGGQQRALFYHQKQTNFNIYLATLKKNENLRDIIFYTCLPVPEIKSLTDWNW